MSDTTTDSELAGLQKALDDGPYLTLMALADWYEDHDEHWIAEGYRWLAKHKKHPNCDSMFPSKWRWFTWNHYSTSNSFEHTITGNLHDGNGTPIWESRTCAEAFHKAAVAVGNMLEKDATRETTLIMCSGCGRQHAGERRNP